MPTSLKTASCLTCSLILLILAQYKHAISSDPLQSEKELSEFIEYRSQLESNCLKELANVEMHDATNYQKIDTLLRTMHAVRSTETPRICAKYLLSEFPAQKLPGNVRRESTNPYCNIIVQYGDDGIKHLIVNIQNSTIPKASIENYETHVAWCLAYLCSYDIKKLDYFHKLYLSEYDQNIIERIKLKSTNIINNPR